MSPFALLIQIKGIVSGTKSRVEEPCRSDCGQQVQYFTQAKQTQWNKRRIGREKD